MTALKAFTAQHIFTGDQWLQQHAVVVADGIISSVEPLASIGSQIELKDMGNSILAPAFIDLQLYGAYDKLFAVFPGTEALQLLTKYSNAGGAAFCMPTVATSST